MLSIMSIFSGAGGFDYAFESTGLFSVRLAIELQPEFCGTLRFNQLNGYMSTASILESDATAVRPKDALTTVSNAFSPDGIIGGPPCESFTEIGKRLGRGDPRGTLVFTFANWVKAIKPRFFVMENVPWMEKIEGGAIIEDLNAEFRDAGYSVSRKILNAADFGAATFRKRLIMVGLKNEARFIFPEPSHVPPDSFDNLLGLAPYQTVRDAIGDLPSPSFQEPGVPQAHVMVRHSDEVRSRFATIPEGGVDRIRKRARLRWSGQSPSLIAGNLNGIRSHIHPSDPRELTNRESARIHGFPDGFHFVGNHAAIGKQIANSVPIPLGMAIARAISEQLGATD